MLFLMTVYIFLCAQLLYFSSRSTFSTRLYFSLRFDMSMTMYRYVSFVRYFTALFIYTFTLYLEVPRQTGYFMPTRCGEVKPEASGPFTQSQRGRGGK